MVFLLDASGSMQASDRDGAARDFISQLTYSFPTPFRVGFAAYSDDVVYVDGLDDREAVATAAGATKYAGYSNAGAGLNRAVELLSSAAADQKSVVLISDGEVFLRDSAATEQSAEQFRSAVEAARAQGITVHVLDLASADGEGLIASAAPATGGQIYPIDDHAGFRAAADDILSRLGVKKLSAAIVEAGGGVETVEIPVLNASVVRILLTGDGPIQNLKADFTAEQIRQYTGSNYALLKLDHPTSRTVKLSFESNAGARIRADVFTEYALEARADAAYTGADAETAEVKVTFCDAENPMRQALTEDTFKNRIVRVTVGDETHSVPLENGALTFPCAVTEGQPLSLFLDMSDLDANITLTQPEAVMPSPSAEEAPQRDLRPYAVVGGLGLLLALFLLLGRKKPPEQSAAVPAAPPAPSKYSYGGRLNIYVTQTRSGRDVPPLTYDLFRLPGNKTLTLREVLDGCGVDEAFDGADAIRLQAGGNRSLILTNDSNCTLMHNRAILMKGRSYQLALNSKVDITFEDERSEMVLQYREHM